jgi:hypothetical protein
MGKLVNLEEISIDRIDSIIVEFPIVKRFIERFIKVFLQSDSEYLITYTYLWNYTRTG